jgi:hypothetical protein
MDYKCRRADVGSRNRGARAPRLLWQEERRLEWERREGQTRLPRSRCRGGHHVTGSRSGVLSHSSHPGDQQSVCHRPVAAVRTPKCLTARHLWSIARTPTVAGLTGEEPESSTRRRICARTVMPVNTGIQFREASPRRTPGSRRSAVPDPGPRRNDGGRGAKRHPGERRACRAEDRLEHWNGGRRRGSRQWARPVSAYARERRRGLRAIQGG